MIHANNKKVVDELLATGDEERINQVITGWRKQAEESPACAQRIEYYDSLQTGDTVTVWDVPSVVVVSRKIVQIYNSATKRNKEFNLEYKDVEKLLSMTHCAYTGVAFSSGNLSRSIDRIDSNKGYVKGNVVAVTVKANSVKEHLLETDNDDRRLTLQEAKQMIDTLVEMEQQTNTGSSLLEKLLTRLKKLVTY